MIRSNCWTFTFVAFLGAFTATAVAQVTPEQQSAIRGACRSDFMSKCSGVTPGGKEALQCLQTNVGSLSPACKTAVSATIPAPPSAAAPARPAQIQTPPPAPPTAATAPAATSAPTAAASSSPPAPPAVKQAAPKPAQVARPPAALKQEAAPPPAPVAAPAAPPAPAPTADQIAAIKFTCRNDFANYCRGVPTGGTEAVDCLQRNTAKLTQDCKTSLAALGDARPAAPGTPPPAAAGMPNAPVVMTAVIGRSCMRDLVLYCGDIKVGDGRKIACLQERGPALSPLCKAALNITGPVR